MSADTHATGLRGRQGAAARAASLIAVAEDLAGEFSLRPLLERILLHCTELLGCTAGSICSVDEAAGTYRKEADIGVACQSGRVFPLTEGMTGAVVAHRAPVWFKRYEERARAEAAADERDRLLGEVHDSLAHRLASIRLHLDSAEGQLTRAADGMSGELAQVAGRLRQASTEATDAIAEARLTLLGLAQSPLNGQTLDAALRSEAAWAASISGLEVRFITAGTPVVLEEELSHEVFSVARETLTNIIRHAAAHSVRIGLLYEQAFVTLLVQDDGQGFDPAAADEKAELLGLRTLSERTRSLGATMQVDSLAGWGTRIRARFPYRVPDGPDAGRLRVLIAADRPVLRAGIARLLSGTEPGIAVVGEAATACEALDACDALKPDVIVADLGLSVGDTAGTADPGESAADLAAQAP